MGDVTHNDVGGDARVNNLVQVGYAGQIHHHVHEGRDGAAFRPWEVPSPPADFVDRQDQLESALTTVSSRRPGQGPVVMAVSGMGGVGKSALASRLANAFEERQHCPDGALYLDLDQLRHDGVVDIGDALGLLLRSLGVRDDRLEATTSARARQYRSNTRGRNLLLVLDNVRFAAESLALLPSSASSTVIVVSHGRLVEWEGVLPLDLRLEPLEEEQADLLLRTIAGVDDPRFGSQARAAQAIVRRCAGLPAALRVAGYWIRRHRHSHLDRLDLKLSDGMRGKEVDVVESVWDAAFHDLSGPAKKLYCLLPQHPGVHLTEASTAALLGTGAPAAQDALAELENSALLIEGWFGLRFHDLLRDHAIRCATRYAEVEGEADTARRRVVLWFTRQAARADLVVAGERMTFASPPDRSLTGDASDLHFPTKAEAARWMEQERVALYGSVRAAWELGLDEAVWGLCESLWTHYLDHRHYGEVLRAFRVGLSAAQRSGNPMAVIRMRCQLARPLWELERFDEADEQLAQARRAAGRLGETKQERKLAASVIEFGGLASRARGDIEAAERAFIEARRRHQDIDNHYGAMLQLHQIGKLNYGAGRWEAAAEALSQAHEEARQLERERMTARTGFELARALIRLGRFVQARPLLADSLLSAEARQARAEQAAVLDAQAELAEACGNPDEAAQLRARARQTRLAPPEQR